MTDITNVFAHLTNTSINKHSDTYNDQKGGVGPGCKRTLRWLRNWFRSQGECVLACPVLPHCQHGV
jgi:tubulin polyglutamylase TTLL2